MPKLKTNPKKPHKPSATCQQFTKLGKDLKFQLRHRNLYAQKQPKHNAQSSS